MILPHRAPNNDIPPVLLKKKNEKKKRKTLYILLSVLLVLVTIRLVMPYFVLKYVNKELSHLTEYYGHVEDIDLALIRGAYVINNIKIIKINKESGQNDSVPFFQSPRVDLSVEWKALLKGKVVGEIEVDQPRVNFVKGRHKGEDVRADTTDFRELIKDLMPLTVNSFRINDGEIHYIDNYSKPQIDLAMRDLDITATNLTNVNKEKKFLPSHAEATGSAYGGTFRLVVDFDGLAKTPTFDMNSEMKDLNLVEMNNFMQAYGNFDVKKGSFGLYTEFAAKQGKFGGYVKPVVKDLDVVQWQKEEGDFKQIIWETIVGTAAELFQNQNKEQLATKIPIEGDFENPDVNLWRAISFVLRNAFVHALKPSIDKTINIGKLRDDGKKTVLETLFEEAPSKDKTDDKKTKKEKRKEKRENDKASEEK